MHPDTVVSTADAPPAPADFQLLPTDLVLVSCVKSKLAAPAPARLLYCSTWFKAARERIEVAGASWLILSARHGLVEPD